MYASLGSAGTRKSGILLEFIFLPVLLKNLFYNQILFMFTPLPTTKKQVYPRAVLKHGKF